MTEETRITIRMPRELAQAIEEAATERGLSPSTLIRNAVDHYLQSLKGTTESDRRRQFSSEYLFLVADLIIQRQYPDAHAPLLREAERRMEALHAAS